MRRTGSKREKGFSSWRNTKRHVLETSYLVIKKGGKAEELFNNWYRKALRSKSTKTTVASLESQTNCRYRQIPMRKKHTFNKVKNRYFRLVLCNGYWVVLDEV